jgi:rod shape-determining protein MreD
MNDPAIYQRLDQWGRASVPALTTAAALILTVIPFGLPMPIEAAPAFGVIGVFYWAVWRPDLMPPSAVFAVGLIGDVLSGNPFGSGAVVLLVTYALALSQRRAFLGKPFWIAWIGFASIAFLVQAMLWILVTLLALHLVDPRQALLQLGLTIAVFPAAAWVLVRIHRHGIGG